MRGTILAFDYRTGEGKISGDDGNRYSFAGREWHGPAQPAPNQSVDFEASASDALAIYPVPGSAVPGVRYERSRVAAAILALLVGPLGIHKVYMGKFGAGIVMLLVSVLGSVFFLPLALMAVISLVEFVIYLTMTDEAFDAAYIKGGKSWF